MSPKMSLLQTHYQWGGVCAIYQTLRAKGYQAFLAGGCVRDALLGRRPKDLDIATDATPDEVEALFPRTVGVGKSFGVIRVLIENADIEVATFRRDGDYKDGRHPDQVVFSTPEEDAKRRDFTVNALFLDPGIEAVLDFVDGEKDLNEKILRAVGDPKKRFAEDYLRILRGVRFTGQLGFQLEKDTLSAMRELADKVLLVSAERITEEMSKLLAADYLSLAMQNLHAVGLISVLFPFREKDLSFLKIPVRENWKRWALFFLPLLAKDNPVDHLQIYLNKLRFSNRDKKNLILCFGVLADPRAYFARRLGERLQMYAEDPTRWACEILVYQNSEFTPDIEWDHRKWLSMGESLPTPLLLGPDVLGRLEGKEIGDCLRAAYIEQLEDLIQTREEALQWLDKNYG